MRAESLTGWHLLSLFYKFSGRKPFAVGKAGVGRGWNGGRDQKGRKAHCLNMHGAYSLEGHMEEAEDDEDVYWTLYSHPSHLHGDWAACSNFCFPQLLF